jgi:thymidylate kinase
MLKLIRNVIEELNVNSLTYCHWKSNLWLAAALEGQTDVDLLIPREGADTFRAILSQLNFRSAQMEDDEPFPAVEHYFGLDAETGVLVHIHAYYEIITGESLAKNYRFPIERMLFENRHEQDGVWVPTKSAELIVFTIRMMLKHTSFVELLLLARDWGKVKQEIAWLLEADSLAGALRLVGEWLPPVDSRLFSRCVAALKNSDPILDRIKLGRQLRVQLRMYARHSAVRSSLIGLRKFSTMAMRRLMGSKKRMKLQSGGAVIAFVGPEATGKSTLLAETKRWLGEYFVVDQVHAGKPKPTILTAIPSLLLPALRSLLPSYRSGHVETEYAGEELAEKSQKVYPLIFGIRSVLLAYDRRALLTRAYAQAASGAIVLCDRYPSTVTGATDSSQLSRFNISRDRSPVRYLLAWAEQRLYQEIPAPALVISLSVPLEVALIRNKTRGKEEPEDFVRVRHARSSQLVFDKATVFHICTDRPLEQTVSDIKQAIWQVL